MLGGGLDFGQRVRLKAMKHRRRILLMLVLLLLVSGLLWVPRVRWPLYGWLRGEAFYRGMPTSWWRNECQCWKYRPIHFDGEWVRDRSQGWLSFIDNYLPAPEMPLFSGDPAALPVLLELLAFADTDVSCELVAIEALHILGPKAKPAVPMLVDIIRRRRKIEGHIFQALDAIDHRVAHEVYEGYPDNIPPP
jgi:hypothetical protein